MVRPLIVTVTPLLIVNMVRLPPPSIAKADVPGPLIDVLLTVLLVRINVPKAAFRVIVPVTPPANRMDSGLLVSASAALTASRKVQLDTVQLASSALSRVLVTVQMVAADAGRAPKGAKYARIAATTAKPITATRLYRKSNRNLPEK